MPPKLDLLQGTLDLMVLQTLAAMGALHGYGIARRIEQVSADEVLLNQGTIYASLVRLQQRGWIAAKWGTSENNRKAKFYSITKERPQAVDRGRSLLEPALRGDGAGAGDVDGRGKVMGAFREAIGRILFFFGKKTRDADLEAEVATHMDLAIEENLRRGMSPQEARRQAMLRFGGVQQAKEEHRETRGLPWLDVLGQDLRFTLRTLGRDRAFTIVAVLILGLGIGANIVVFSVVNTILLRPLPFPESAGTCRGSRQAHPTCGESCRTYSADATEEYRERNKSFQDVTGYFAFTGPDNFKLMGKGVPVPVTGLLVMDNFFQTLGVQPAMGRLFRAEESLPHAPSGRAGDLCLLEAAASAAIPTSSGRRSDFDNGKPVTVVGVLPESVRFRRGVFARSQGGCLCPVHHDGLRG